jgi:hypothetical protein
MTRFGWIVIAVVSGCLWSTVALANKKDKKACAAAQTIPTIEKWQDYLKQFPDGTCARHGMRQVAEMQKDQAQCDKARAEGTLEAWRDYAFRYPVQGLCLAEADAVINAPREEEVTKEEPTLVVTKVFSANIEALHACFGEAPVEADTKDVGVIFTVKDGSIATIESSGGAESERTCIVDLVKTWKFELDGEFDEVVRRPE